jgi:hypothetical protein
MRTFAISESAGVTPAEKTSGAEPVVIVHAIDVDVLPGGGYVIRQALGADLGW